MTKNSGATRHPISTWLAQRLRREEGQSLIVIVLALFLIIAVAALAVDVATWYQRHHQAQVAADAAALAAANCMANAGRTLATTPSVVTDPCTTTTDTTDAISVATTLSKTNGVTISASDISFNSSTNPTTITVKTPDPSPSFFGGLFGLHSSTQTASAAATWTAPTSSNCANPGNSCAAVFAMSTSCSNGTEDGGGSPIIFNGSGDTITGSVHSNGSIYEAGGGDQKLGPTTFGDGSGCEIDWSHESGDTWDGSSTRPTTGEAPITTWPMDYSKVLTPCGSGYSYACTGPDGTPSYCTEAAGTRGYSSISSASYSGFDYGSRSQVPPSGQVWCAYGGGVPSNPATWDGTIYFQADHPSTTVYGTWIAGTIEFGQNGWNLAPQTSTPGFPLLYALGSGNCSNPYNGGVCMSGGGQTLNGAIFAPNGSIQFNGAGSSTDNFLEGQYINFIGGSQDITGIGPTGSGSGSASGTDKLVS